MKLFSMMVKAIGAFFIAIQLVFLMVPSAAAEFNMPAVINPAGICTMDINQCGNASICSCPEGYQYNSTIGYCLISEIQDATGPGATVTSSCSIQVLPNAICTLDINNAGHSSFCSCPEGTEYNSTVGQCILSTER